MLALAFNLIRRRQRGGVDLPPGMQDQRRSLRRQGFDEDPGGPAYLAARDEYYRAYERARSAYTKLRLPADGHRVVELADAAIEQATQIKDAGAEEERGEVARTALFPPENSEYTAGRSCLR